MKYLFAAVLLASSVAGFSAANAEGGCGPGMHRGNGSLQLIGTERAAAEGFLDESEALGDFVVIPQRAILFFECDERGIDHAGVAPRIVK